MENIFSFFTTRNGQTVLNEDLSEKLYEITNNKPEASVNAEVGYEWNEMGMALLFSQLYKNEARYCPEHKTWYTYHDGAWRRDEAALLVSGKLMDFTRLMYIYCAEIESEEKRDAYLRFVSSMGDRRFRDRVLKDATTELKINACEFDANPHLINCINGTYDLRDFSFREHSYADFITKQTRFSHTVDRTIRCERWIQFIKEVTDGDKEKSDFLQRALGYSLFGIANEECMFILHGKSTRNGKSTLLNTLEIMLGDYAKVAPVGMICKGDRAKDADAASPSLARLKGTRFVTMAESNEYGKLDEEKIKQLTGGEEITARELYQKPISFTPQFTLWLSCNSLPTVTDKSLFASKRIKVIEFNRHFKPEEQDKDLKQEFLKQENMAGIFMWLVNGFAKYKSQGLTMAKKLEQVNDNYEKDNDLVLQFLEARCEKDSLESVTCDVLYKTYKLWMKSNGYRHLSFKRFVDEMEKHQEQYISRDNTRKTVIYHGLKLQEAI